MLAEGSKEEEETVEPDGEAVGRKGAGSADKKGPPEKKGSKTLEQVH